MLHVLERVGGHSREANQENICVLVACGCSEKGIIILSCWGGSGKKKKKTRKDEGEETDRKGEEGGEGVGGGENGPAVSHRVIFTSRPSSNSSITERLSKMVGM